MHVTVFNSLNVIAFSCPAICEFVRCMHGFVCLTYILTCGQGCVTVLSLVNVAKRGLIISNLIHSVTSHYFHIPTPISVSLLPLIFLFSLFLFYLSVDGASLYLPHYGHSQYPCIYPNNPLATEIKNLRCTRKSHLI